MRGYRPGPMGGETFEDESWREKEERVRLYLKRAAAGMPLFEPPVKPLTAPIGDVLDTSIT